MATYEKPQSGNPHQLTVNQHCFPRACIARFCDHTGTVAIKTLSDGVLKRAKPTAKIFCAKRTWDQRAESGYMLNIENNYRALAERVITSGHLSLSSEDSKIVSAMYYLWTLRIQLRDSPLDDCLLDGVDAVAVVLSKDQIEMCEKAKISSVRPDFTLPGRQIAGARLQIELNRKLRNLKGTNWHLRQSLSQEFIVPDRSPARMILPLCPTLCFYHENESAIHNQTIDVAEMNRIAISDSAEYYFARNLV